MFYILRQNWVAGAQHGNSLVVTVKYRQVLG